MLWAVVTTKFDKNPAIPSSLLGEERVESCPRESLPARRVQQLPVIHSALPVSSQRTLEQPLERLHALRVYEVLRQLVVAACQAEERALEHHRGGEGCFAVQLVVVQGPPVPKAVLPEVLLNFAKLREERTQLLGSSTENHFM